MSKFIEIAAQLVSSQVSKTPMTTDQMIREIEKVYTSLKNLDSGLQIQVEMEVKPALTVKKAFKKNEVVCMVCGKGNFKILSRHLQAAHDMSQKEYRKQFDIPSGQSLAAKSYSDARKKMALDRDLAGNLAKAREMRKAKLVNKAVAKPADSPVAKVENEG